MSYFKLAFHIYESQSVEKLLFIQKIRRKRSVLRLGSIMFVRCAAAGTALLLSSSLICAPPRPSLFEWGNGRYQPRPGHPDDILNFSNFQVRQVATFSRDKAPVVQTLAYGPTHTAVIDSKGDLYLSPLHHPNNVQLDDVNDSERVVALLQAGGKYKQAAFTRRGVLFALNEKGEVWQWRFDKDPEAKPRQIPTLKAVKQIATGADHFAAIDSEGHLYTMGDDTFGQCGIHTFGRTAREPYFELRYPNPTRVESLKGRVKEVACGSHHTLAVLESGEVRGWGRNDKRQIGPTEETLNKMPLAAIFEPVPILNLTTRRISKVAAGDSFSFFISEDREVYGCGLNTRGQLGLGYLNHTIEFTPVPSLTGFVVREGEAEREVGIKELKCGAEHCLALLDVGAVYSWGGNEYGEQGNQRRVIADRPTLLKQFQGQRVSSVFVGTRCSAILTSP